jgi:hypothetical protein
MLDRDHSHITARSITKTVRIARDPEAAFDFLADGGHYAANFRFT